MKKLLVICFIACVGFAATSSATGKHNVITNYSVYSDTTPMGMGMDTMNKGMNKKGKKMRHSKMNSDSGMTMQSDSSNTTAPPVK